MTVRRPLIAGNWKMNGLRADGLALVRDLCARIEGTPEAPFDMLVCPPATLLVPVAAEIAGRRLALGGQDCHADASGAYTGDIGAPMLKDAGCAFVIVGHSERRQNHGEGDSLVRAKAAAAHRAGLTAIICVGETEEQRDAGHAEEVVRAQLQGSIPDGATASDTVIAYEPVWAIGTGRTPTVTDIAAMHGAIRARLAGLVRQPDQVRILYGGSVKPSNAVDILALEEVDGALVGGASLKAEDFWAIASAVR